MARKKAKKKMVRTGEKALKDLKSRELTEEEKARLDKYHKRSQREPVKFKNEESDSGNSAISVDNPDDPLLRVKISEALGTSDSDLQGHLLDQVTQAFKGVLSTDGADYDKAVQASNNAMAILDGIQPQDEVEGMLAVQMIGVHNLAMEAIQRAMLGGQTFEGKKANVNHATQMLRTFIIQMEALKKYRTRGPQKVMIGDVNVSQGGQAIVGTVQQRIDKTGSQE